MGEIGNGMFYFQKPWCKTKCRLDQDFKMPYDTNDTLILQMDLSRFASSAAICKIFAVTMDGTRVSGDLKAQLGPAYYKNNRDVNGMNIFTLMLLPQTFGGCTNVEVPIKDCCFIDTFEMGDSQDGSWDFFRLIVNGVTYDLMDLTSGLPPGWQYVGSSTPAYRFLQFPCSQYEGATILIDAKKIGDDLAVEVMPVVQLCGSEICECYYEIPEAQYAEINTVFIHGIRYDGPAILTHTPSIIPGISDANKHTLSGGKYKVPVDCNNDSADFQIGDDRAGTKASVFVKFFKINCSTRTVTKKLNCFAFEFVLGFNGNCDVFSIYSEPYECIDASCDRDTAILYTNYKGKDQDTLGLWVFKIGELGDPALNEGGLGNFEDPGLRLPAILLDLPTKITLTENDACFLYKSEAVRTFKIQGTKAYPPWFARFVESIMCGTTGKGAHFGWDGAHYRLAADKVFDTIPIPGISAFKLETTLEQCKRYTYFNCTS